MKELRLWLYLWDIHFSQCDEKTFRAILFFIRQSRVDGLLLGGDALDLSCVSHWVLGSAGDEAQEKRRGELRSDLDGFDKQILQPLEALLPRGCEKVFLTGNHERMPDQDLIESMPELDGMIDFKQYLHLTERGFKVIPLGGDYQIGGLLCIHPGEAVGSAGSNAAKKAVEIYCQNVFRGHGHQLQSSSKCSPSSSKKTAAA
jgi:hypothetical protein